MGKPLHDAGTNRNQTTAQQIAEIARGFKCGAGMKSAHLVNISLATLKWLMMNSESDDIRFKAAEALLGLQPMRAKLGLMGDVVAKPFLGKEARPAAIGKRLSAAMKTPEQAARVIQLLEQVEAESRSNASSGAKAA